MNYTTIAEMLFPLIPLLDKKFVRPIDQQFRTISSPLQCQVMGILHDKKAATMTELSTEMLMSKQQMTLIIDKLVAEGFVQRASDTVDRRMIRISLTPAGLNLTEKIKEKALTLIEQKIKGLDENDLLCLNNALTDLYKIMHKLT